MGFLDRRRKKKDNRLIFAPRETQNNAVEEYIRTLEANYGFYALQEIKFQTKKRKEWLKLARKRQKRGLKYIG